MPVDDLTHGRLDAVLLGGLQMPEKLGVVLVRKRGKLGYQGASFHGQRQRLVTPIFVARGPRHQGFG